MTLIAGDAFRKYSALSAPLVPVEKFSTERTVFFSRGTLVPPEVTTIIVFD